MAREIKYQQENAPVSVIIPFSPKHTPVEMLEEAKESVVDQSICTEIIVIEDTKEKGPAWARNQGLKESNSRFISFLDADDRWYPGKLKKQLKLINKYNVGLCVEGSKNQEISYKKFTDRILFGDLSSLTSSILIDTKHVNICFREELERLEDHLFMIEAAIEHGVCLSSGPLVEIRKHDHGLSAQGKPEQTYNSQLEIAKYLQEQPELKEKADQLRQLAHYNLGRQKQLHGQPFSSILPLAFSLRYGISIKALGALMLIPWYTLKRPVPSRLFN
jgi:glycosyltransferase involved in cell wall biosynthesis